MDTKNTLKENTANGALAHAVYVNTISTKVGRNFAKPIPRKIAENKKSFWAQFKKV